MSGPIVPGDLVMVVRGRHAGATGTVVDRYRARLACNIDSGKSMMVMSWRVCMSRPLQGRTDWAWCRGDIIKLAPGKALDATPRKADVPA